MGKKRKRHRKSGDNVDESPNFKRQRSSNSHEESHVAFSNSHAEVNPAAAPPTVTSIHSAVERAVRILAPPEGLDLDQRKLWRELTRNAAASVAAVNVRPQDIPHSHTGREARVLTKVDTTKPIIDRSTLSDLSTTRLLPAPRRSWHVERENGSRLLPKPSPRFNLEEGSGTNLNPTSDFESNLSSDSESTSSKPGEGPSQQVPKAPQPPEWDLWRANGTPKRINSQHLAHIGDEGSISLVTQRTSVNSSLRRSSFGQKAASIPSFSGSMDTASAFRRFTAFLHGRGGESSEDESDSELDSDSADNSPAMNERQTPAEQPQLVENGDGQPSYMPDLVHSSKTSVARPETQYFHTSLPERPELKSITSIKANVGIKRQASLPVPEHIGPVTSPGGTIYQHHPPTLTHKLSESSPGPFHDSDNESEDIIQTINEISRNVFAATRPLPASKLPVSPDPERMDLEDGMLTLADSNRRVTRSMSTPKKSPIKHKIVNVPLAPSAVVICNSVRVPDVSRSVLAKSGDERQISSELPRDTKASGGNVDNRALSRESSSSSLSELSRSPSPPLIAEDIITATSAHDVSTPATEEVIISTEEAQNNVPTPKRKRKMTGMTSKHFTPEKRSLRTRTSARLNREPNGEIAAGQSPAAESEAPNHDEGSGVTVDAVPVSASTRSSTAKKRKGTGKKSTYFTPTKPPLDPDVIDRVDFYNSTGKKKRVPAGVSTAPVPPISSDRFGIIQEKLWKEPFWLLIAVTFLNKTAGRAAAPVFWELKKRYPTPEDLAAAKLEDLHTLIWHLGLQRQRSKRLIAIASAWVEAPPEKGRRWRTLHYPVPGDGKAYKQSECVEEDSDECTGALEIGHIPGCGPYAWDSWRMFCRDVLRGVAEDYNGKGARAAASPSKEEGEGFVPEWQKVLPLDKELRACLRWMWLREGWIWNHETGEKRKATVEEMEMAEKGEMEVADEQERKFAEQAAGVEDGGQDLAVGWVGNGLAESPLVGSKIVIAEENRQQTPELEDNGNAREDVIVTPLARPVRRSARLTA